MTNVPSSPPAPFPQQGKGVNGSSIPAGAESPPGYREDPRGHLVPERNIHPRDLLADQLVRDLIGRVQEAAAHAADLKRDLLGDVAAFVQLVAADYGAVVSGADGSLSLTSYDGRLKIERSRADRIQVGPEIIAAEELVRQILAEITDPIAKPIAERAFSRHRKTGELSAAKLIALAGVEIDDPRWRLAQQAIKDALQVTGSVTYFRAYRRADPDKPWVQIALDFSAVEPSAPRAKPAPPQNTPLSKGGVGGIDTRPLGVSGEQSPLPPFTKEGDDREGAQ